MGNVFDLGVKYPKAFGFIYKDKEGSAQTPIMGCYGIGTTRLMGTAVEVLSDERGIIWPESIAPFSVHLIELGDGLGKEAYTHLQAKGIEVLYDDRDCSAGEKFADADLIGIPWRAVVSPKTGDKIEIKKRGTEDIKLMTLAAFVKALESKT